MVENTELPLVSVIIPTKNRCDLLKKTLASVQVQTYQNWEAIVVDDASEDDTAKWVHSLSLEDNRIRLIEREGEKGGAQVARNQGFRLSRGEFVIFLDSDDLLAPFSLDQRIKFMTPRPELDFCIFETQFFRDTPGDLKSSDIHPYRNLKANVSDLDAFICAFTPWITTGPTWRRPALEKLGSWDEDLPLWQDWNFHIRALLQGFIYLKANVCDHYIRIHTASRDRIENGHERRVLSQVQTARAHELVRKKAVDILKERKALSPRRRLLLTWTFWSSAVDLTRSSPHATWQVREAIKKLWYASQEKGLIGKFMANLGYIAISMNRFPLVGGLAYRMATWIFISYLFLSGKITNPATLKNRQISRACLGPKVPIRP
jgi:glycosyltransferase involved in cell wall biosynthesis